jgi:Zn-dependent metalloprotease
MPFHRPLPWCLFFILPAAFLPAADPGPVPAKAPETEVLARELHSRLAGLAPGPDCDLEVKDVLRDPDGSRHVRLQQRYRGLRVWGGQAILHLDPRGVEGPPTDALVRGIQVDTHPNLGPSEALAITNQDGAPHGSYNRSPTTELVVYPASALERAEGSRGGDNARDFAPRVTRHHLAYHIHTELQNGAPETRRDDFLVDAHTGAVLKRWSTLFTLKGRGKPATTMGKSQYSGEVRLGSLSMDCGYVMSDPTRGYISTRDLAGGTFGHGVLYVSQTGLWGDGQNYDPSRGTRSENGQTAAVDAQYGLQTTWDFYGRVLQRDGIDGTGRTVYNLVHYATTYDNAFWDDQCFCMTYGDGEMYKTLTALDVVGHEVSHGLCHATADLEYDGESGGLNEANSDIFGSMIRLYGTAGRGKGTRLPAQGAVWTIGADLATPLAPAPIRYMYKPSLDGFSPDDWTPDLDQMDVHMNSGPMNRAFYFLSQGASANPRDDTHTRHLPKGMKGVGNDKALRIWWRTLSTYLTPTSRYLDARHGAIRAAEDLYGPCSLESLAVRLAFRGINVDEVNSSKY